MGFCGINDLFNDDAIVLYFVPLSSLYGICNV